MREFKFRAYNKKHNKMIVNDDSEWFVSDLNTEDENWTKAMQYTGLKDKNGKEIYEKDVCEIWMGCKQDGYYVVEDLRELYLDMNHADSYYRITRIEVVGNIYENPELVEVDNQNDILPLF